MPLVRTPALILHGLRYGETSRILRLLTPEHGLRSVIAKGAQRPRSHFGGVLEPFTEGEAHFNLREGRDLFILSGFSLLRSRQGIGRDLGAFAGASLMVEITLRAATEEPLPELYAAISAALDRLCDPEQQAAGVALGASWHLLSLFGFQPELDACIHCTRSLDPEAPTRFDPAGGTACRICAPHAPALDPELRSELALMSAGHPVRLRPGTGQQHGALVRDFLSLQLAPERALRTLPLFLDSLR